MKRRRFELLAFEAYEGGKPWAEADAQVAEAIDFLEYYAREMLRLKDGVEIYAIPGEESRYSYQAMGVGVIIAPWNFPTAILTGMSSAAIVAGNTIVMKPSEFTPVIGSVVAEIFEEAGLPEGVLNYLPGYGSEVGDYLVEDARTRFISFTGSMRTGLRINELAAKQIERQRWVKRVIAEMAARTRWSYDSATSTRQADSSERLTATRGQSAAPSLGPSCTLNPTRSEQASRGEALRIGAPRERLHPRRPLATEFEKS